MTTTRFGLSCAISTPFAPDGAIDTPRLIEHARKVMKDGCGSVTLFGTTGEGFSIGPKERVAVLAGFAKAGFDMRREVGCGVMGASVEEAAAQSAQALDAGCKALLLAPPFYFKGVSDDGLFAWHSTLFAALGSKVRDVVLYNLPAHTGVTISHALIGRLRKAFPKVITAVKDSSGNWPYTERLLKEHGDIAILIGDERHLAKAVRMGGQGSICGLANSYATRLKRIVDDGTDDPIVNKLVDATVSFPVLPAVKAMIAARSGHDGWRKMRAPLDDLPVADAARLVALCDGIEKGK